MASETGVLLDFFIISVFVRQPVRVSKKFLQELAMRVPSAMCFSQVATFVWKKGDGIAEGLWIVKRSMLGFAHVDKTAASFHQRRSPSVR